MVDTYGRKEAPKMQTEDRVQIPIFQAQYSGGRVSVSITIAKVTWDALSIMQRDYLSRAAKGANNTGKHLETLMSMAGVES